MARRLLKGITSTVTRIQLRGISEHSWAKEFIIANGGSVEAAAAKESVFVTEQLLRTPSEKIEKLSNEILALNIVESSQLFGIIQERLGISDSDSGGGGGGAAVEAAPEPVAVKDIFDLKLTVVDAKAKIKVIKEVRTITGLGLKEAKELVEKAPVVIKAGLKTEEAEQLKKVLIEAGAEVLLV